MLTISTSPCPTPDGVVIVKFVPVVVPIVATPRSAMAALAGLGIRSADMTARKVNRSVSKLKCDRDQAALHHGGTAIPPARRRAPAPRIGFLKAPSGKARPRRGIAKPMFRNIFPN